MYQDSLYTSMCSSKTLQSESNGFFQQFADYITTKVGPGWLENFGKLTNNEERIEKCYSDNEVGVELQQVLSNVQEVYRKKSAHISVTKRQEAKQWLKKGKLDHSLLLYNQSVIRAPPTGFDKTRDNGLSLALALWGRSECLFQLKRYDSSLTDVKLCLKEKLPPKLKLDAYVRMAECYEKLKDLKKLRVCLNVIDKLIDNVECSELVNNWKDKVKSRRNFIEQCERVVNDVHEVRSQRKDYVTTLTGGENKRYKGASKLLKLARSDTGGRYMVAAAPIKTGDTLIAEDAYVSCLLPEKFGTHCQHCFSRLYSVIPCEDCSGVAFCSEECKTAATDTYHRYECRYMDMMIGSGMSILCFLALRMVTQKDKRVFFNNNDIEEDIDDMERHTNKRKSWDMFHRTLMALFLLTILKKCGYFDERDTFSADSDKLKLFVGRILLRNLEVLQFNAHEIYETITCEKQPGKIKMVNIGAGLYKSASLFNHDCYAAIARYFVGAKLVMKALRPINTGEMVPENYGPSFTTQTLVQRRRNLSSRYWFECRCKACIEDWPTLNELDRNVRYRCTTCRKGIDLPEENSTKCRTDTEIANELNNVFQNGIRKIETRQYDPAINLLSSFSEKAEKFYERPVKNLCACHEKLRMLWSLQGNVHRTNDKFDL